MEMLFEVETPYTEEVYRELNIFHMANRKKGNRIFLIIASILVLLCGLGLIFLKSYSFGIVYTILGVVFLLWTLFVPSIIAKKVIKSDKLIKENLVNVTAFFDEYFEQANEQSDAKIYYNQLYDAYEAKQYFYLYLNKMTAYVISKNRFKKGTEMEFRGFLKQKLGDKFKITI